MAINLEKNLVLDQRPRLKEACLKLRQVALERGAGEKLPPLTELRSTLGVSVGTLHSAVRELERTGVLRSINGVGIYVANPAQAPKTGKLGLLFRGVKSYKHPYMMDLLSGVQREAKQQRLEIVLLDEETNAVEPGKLDALLMLCHETEALLMNLPPNLPHALLFRHCPDFTCVAVDNFEGGKMATRHLLELGHRRIACLAYSDSDAVALLRLAGYEAAHRDAGVPIDRKLVRFCPKLPSGNYREQGELAMRSLLENDWTDLGCTAIVARNDEAAIGMMKVLAEAHIRVPQDVSVVGFDGTEICDLCTPRLTSIKVPLEEIGARAVKVLLEQMREGVSRTEKINLPVQLKLGESTQEVLSS